MSELDLVRGTLDVLILKSLSAEPMHGYSVARWIKRASGDELLEWYAKEIWGVKPCQVESSDDPADAINEAKRPS